MASVREKVERLRRMNEALDEKKERISKLADRVLQKREDSAAKEDAFDPALIGSRKREPPSPRIRRAAKASASREGGLTSLKGTMKQRKKEATSANCNGARGRKPKYEDKEEEKDTLEPLDVDEDDANFLSDLGSKADEMGPTAIARVQKAQIRGLKNRIKHLSDQLERAEKKLEGRADVRDEIGKVKDRNEKLEKQIAKETRKVFRLTKNLADAKEEASKLRLELKAAKKDIDELKRSLRDNKSAKASKQTSGSDVRLNRALAEIERYKTEVNELKLQKDSDVDTTKDRLKRQEREIRTLERQRTELLAAFKKQAKLIDILKRQKMHIEAAKLLSFTEEEFVKAIERGI